MRSTVKGSFLNLIGWGVALGVVSIVAGQAWAQSPRDSGLCGRHADPNTEFDDDAAPGLPDYSDDPLLPVATHQVQHFEWLGDLVDEEAGVNVPDDNATLPRADNDGLVRAFMFGGGVFLVFDVTTNEPQHPLAFEAGSLLYVDAWIDWNRNNIFADAPGEYIGTWSNHPTAPGWANEGIPPNDHRVRRGATIGGNRWMNPPGDYNIRLRLDWHSAAGVIAGEHAIPPPAGGPAHGTVGYLSSFGEVEDYKYFEIEYGYPNQPCVKCSWSLDGDDWVAQCADDYDIIGNSVVMVGVSTDPDCNPETDIPFMGPFVVKRDPPVGSTIPMELVDMQLTATGGLTLVAGAKMGGGGFELGASTGAIIQTDPQYAEAYLDVYFEIELPGGVYGYNHEALRLTAEGFDCVPPDISFEAESETCLQVYDVPPDVPNPIEVGRVTFTSGPEGALEHDTYTDIPTVSQWGLFALTLLVLTAGTVVLRRHRALAG